MLTSLPLARAARLVLIDASRLFIAPSLSSVPYIRNDSLHPETDEMSLTVSWGSSFETPRDCLIPRPRARSGLIVTVYSPPKKGLAPRPYLGVRFTIVVNH